MLTSLNKPTTSLITDSELRGSSQFLSRIFTDINGRQFRLTFLVAVVDGELRGHLVSAEPISSSAPSNVAQLTGSVSNTGNGDETFCLPIICSEKEPCTEYIPAFTPVVSPYFSLLEFLINSQPTRAPSHN